MEKLIDTIRAATESGAADDVRAAGAQACRTILAALEATRGEPLAVAPTMPLQAIASVVRGMNPEQLLDLAIARLKAALPTGTEPSVQPVKFNLVAVPVKS